MRTLAEHILDTAMNSIRAQATLIEIIVTESKIKDLWALTLTDNGCGMDKKILQQATDPFFTSRTTRKVGLGLSLLKQNAEATGGGITIDSESWKGTKVQAEFGLSHIDRLPVGDISETLYLLFLGFPRGELSYRHLTDEGEFNISTSELKNALGDISLQNREIRNGVIEIIKTSLGEIGAII